MPKLYHIPLSPYCRKVRIALREKGIEADLEAEPVWERRDPFLELNTAGTVPVYVDDDGTAICDSAAICEYLEEVQPEPILIGRSPAERAETRRLIAWFDGKFAREVTDQLYGEKVVKRMLRTGEPSSAAIRAGKVNVVYHLEYVAWLTERRNWLGGDSFSLADIAAAAHLSTIDFLGDVPWDRVEGAKQWYQRIKSRPSFRPLLADQVPGLRPPRHYADLDF
ncbi:MAG: glutathione S-transferase family protein [Alphaproteobacteria bacterium]